MKLNLEIFKNKYLNMLLLTVIGVLSLYLVINDPALFFFLVVFSIIGVYSYKSKTFRVIILLFTVLFIPTTDYFPFLDFNKYLPINLGLPLNMYTITLGIVMCMTLYDKLMNRDILLVSKDVFKLEIVFFIYIFVMFISVIKADILSEGLKDILRYLSFTYLAFWVVINNIKNKIDLQKIFKVLVIFVTILSIYALIEFALGINIYYELFRDWGSNNFVYDGGKRVFSTLGHPNIFASILSIVIPIHLNLIMISDESRNLKLYVFGLYINAIALVLTFSRASWVACFLSVFLYFLIQKDKKYFISKIIKYFAPTFLVTIAGSIVAVIFNENVRNSLYYLIVTRLNIQNMLSSGSVTYRSVKILTAKKIILQHPIMGVGYGNYSAISDLPQYKHHLDSNVIKVLDNNYLTIMVETGIIGMLTFIALFYSIIKKTREISYLGDGILCSIISVLVSAASFELFRVTPISVVLWCIIGLLFACLVIDKKNSDYMTRYQHIKRYIRRIK